MLQQCVAQHTTGECTTCLMTPSANAWVADDDFRFFGMLMSSWSPEHSAQSQHIGEIASHKCNCRRRKRSCCLSVFSPECFRVPAEDACTGTSCSSTTRLMNLQRCNLELLMVDVSHSSNVLCQKSSCHVNSKEWKQVSVAQGAPRLFCIKPVRTLQRQITNAAAYSAYAYL